MIKNNIKKIIITTIFLTLSNCSALTENSNNGCTDQSACNYNVNAEIDDGSCLIASGCDSCTVDSNNEQYTNGSGTLIDGDRDDDSTCDNSDLIDFTYNIARK